MLVGEVPELVEGPNPLAMEGRLVSVVEPCRRADPSSFEDYLALETIAIQRGTYPNAFAAKVVFLHTVHQELNAFHSWKSRSRIHNLLQLTAETFNSPLVEFKFAAKVKGCNSIFYRGTKQTRTRRNKRCTALALFFF